MKTHNTKKLVGLIIGLLLSVELYPQLQISEIRAAEGKLEDVMEFIDTAALRVKLKVVEKDYELHSTPLNKLRLGILLHEAALSFDFLAQDHSGQYATKSYKILSELDSTKSLPAAYAPFVLSYRASAVALVSASSSNLKLLSEAFNQFDAAVSKYATLCALPEFLRGSVAENLPKLMFRKKKFAALDFTSIITKYEANAQYANTRVMSFSYWAWANQHKSKKHRTQSLKYLQKAIDLDPDFTSGRTRAEKLKAELEQ